MHVCHGDSQESKPAANIQLSLAQSAFSVLSFFPAEGRHVSCLVPHCGCTDAVHRLKSLYLTLAKRDSLPHTSACTLGYGCTAVTWRELQICFVNAYESQKLLLAWSFSCCNVNGFDQLSTPVHCLLLPSNVVYDNSDLHMIKIEYDHASLPNSLQ